MRRADGDERTPVYVWDLGVRLTHWLVVLSVLVLAATGFYIGRPFIVTHGGFVTGWVKVVHSYAAIVFTTAVVARIVWMFAGSPAARWTELVPTTRPRLSNLSGTLKFYLFFRADPPRVTGHNGLAGVTYLVVFALYLVMIATGLGLYAIDSGVGSPSRLLAWVPPLLGGAQSTRWIHHVGMWLLLGFMVHHIFSAVLWSRVEKDGTMDSIFSGYKYPLRGSDD